MVNAFSLILLLLLFPFKAMLQHFNFLLFYRNYSAIMNIEYQELINVIL